MSGYSQLAVASFVGVYLKAFQQRNVAFDKYHAIPIFSFGMAAAEVFVIVHIVDFGLTLSTVAWMGLGGTLGCWVAMWSHNRLFGGAR